MPSVDETAQRSLGAGIGRPTRAPTAEEAERGVVSWSLNREGVWEPFYEGEKEAPNGVGYFIDYWRDRLQAEARASSAQATTEDERKEARNGNHGIDEMTKVTVVKGVERGIRESGIEDDGDDKQ